MSVQDAPPATPVKSHLSNGIAQDQSAASQLTPEDKKRRALQKKLGAIEALKARRAAGEKLEKTQEKKIEAEDEVKKELSELSG
jgi:translation initiation factor 2A